MMEDVIAAARRIEKILKEQTDTKMEPSVNTMKDQIRILQERPQRGQRANHCSQSRCSACNRHGCCPCSNRCSRSTASSRSRSPPLPRLQRGTAILPPSQPSDRLKTAAMLCREEGHFVSNCPARLVLQHLLRQQALTSTRRPPRGQILELPPQEDDSHSNPNVQLNC